MGSEMTVGNRGPAPSPHSRRSAGWGSGATEECPPALQTCPLDTQPGFVSGACAVLRRATHSVQSCAIILKFLIILSLNLCFVSETQWDIGACVGDVETRAGYMLTAQ